MENDIKSEKHFISAERLAYVDVVSPSQNSKPHHTVCTNRKHFRKLCDVAKNTHISAVWRWAELQLLMLFELVFFLLLYSDSASIILCFSEFYFSPLYTLFFCFFAFILICIYFFRLFLWRIHTYRCSREEKQFFTFCFVLCDFSHSIFVDGV